MHSQSKVCITKLSLRSRVVIQHRCLGTTCCSQFHGSRIPKERTKLDGS